MNMTKDRSLENDFMRFVGVTSEGQKQIQEYYLPFFESHSPVVDLACGDGDFVELLNERGISCRGIDRDPAMCREAKARGRTIVCQDVFEFLKGELPESIGGLFSAHLVEHLPYEKVIELIELGYRVLRPGGVIIIATPNVRGLFPHLESFYMHYGHTAFYHPKLLAFFLTQAGFEKVEVGENDRLRRPLWGDLPERLVQASEISVTPSESLASVSLKKCPVPLEMPPFEHYQRHSLLGFRGFILRFLSRGAHNILKPYLFEIRNRFANINAILEDYRMASEQQQILRDMQLRDMVFTMEILANNQRSLANHLAGILEQLDRSVECYAIGRKPR